MTKQHFIRAAEIVREILEGLWTNDAPVWASGIRHVDIQKYTRAVLTAEAFITLFRAYNDRFDEQRFLVACGLVDAPAKPKRTTTKPIVSLR